VYGLTQVKSRQVRMACCAVRAPKAAQRSRGNRSPHQVRSALSLAGGGFAARSPYHPQVHTLESSPALLGQERLLPFLRDPASYPHQPRHVRIVQTHASFVCIAPPFVFKVKKAVDYGFLNFSTLERRRHFCEREVELNRRLSSGVYLGVIPISRVNGSFTFGAAGDIVEYAVKMRRLSAGGFLNERIRRGVSGSADLDRVARALKSFYVSQHPTRKVEAWGRVDKLRLSTNENFRQTRAFVGRTLSLPAFETIRFYTRQFYRRHQRLFDSRVRRNWIRDCHGDLHLEHIHISPRALQIYDCIEFNDRFRYVDVASDAAFLAMDLDFQGRPDLARHFVHRLSAALRDDGMPGLMDFYKGYRAYVRGKVESLHSAAHATPEAKRQVSEERAGRYFRLALQYAIAGSRPLVLVIMGRIASGKSTLATALGVELGWPVISSDKTRKTLAGLPLHQRSRSASRSRLYSAAMTEKTYERLIATAEFLARSGRSVILDATFDQRVRRAQLARRLSGQGIAFRFLEAQVDDRMVQERLEARKNRADEISDARVEDFAALTARYEPPVELPVGRRLCVRTCDSIAITLTRALRELARAQVEAPCQTT